MSVNWLCSYFAVFQNVFKAPQFCSRCGVAYKVVRELRGYMCVSLIFLFFLFELNTECELISCEQAMT